MTEPTWKVVVLDATVYRQWPDGREESMSMDNPEYLAWVAAGNEPLPYVEPEKPPEPTLKDKLATVGITIEDLKAELGIA